MTGDVLLIGEKHRRASAEILKRLRGKKLKRFVIAVGGESGTGKSEIAHLLRAAFRKKRIMSKILHIDNYYRIPPAQRTSWRKKKGISKSVGTGEYKWPLINRHIKAFRNAAEKVRLPFIDIITDQEDTLITNFKDIDVLIIEGLYAVAADADYRVLIDLDYHYTKDAQKLRGKEPQNRYRAQVLEAEHAAVTGIRDRADLLITKKMMGLK